MLETALNEPELDRAADEGMSQPAGPELEVLATEAPGPEDERSELGVEVPGSEDEPTEPAVEAPGRDDRPPIFSGRCPAATP